jgi:hypothetical protein
MGWSRGNGEHRAFAKAEALKAAVARVKKLYSSINATHALPVHVTPALSSSTSGLLSSCWFYSTVGSWVNRWRAEDSWQWALYGDFRILIGAPLLLRLLTTTTIVDPLGLAFPQPATTLFFAPVQTKAWYTSLARHHFHGCHGLPAPVDNNS